ncbi:hypothetical protein Y032_0015g2710 [Ancylostoma ceylanicum]|uniref:Uncharacterized protein n=1 Tax=Ancylostoma ceylanicum TaxID=53326 RepID=A0A016V7E4_9BILA|nr:hypothetical protein Y032_0015g2710 [Ancylostoma ceylanicum]
MHNAIDNAQPKSYHFGQSSDIERPFLVHCKATALATTRNEMDARMPSPMTSCTAQKPCRCGRHLGIDE